MAGLSTGDIANDCGDIHWSAACRPIAEGRLGLPTGQALAALAHGWRWIETHDMGDEQWIIVQRGSELWRCRQAGDGGTQG